MIYFVDLVLIYNLKMLSIGSREVCHVNHLKQYIDP